MAEFTVIETQEQFDKMVQDRLKRNTEKVTAEVEKKYSEYISPDDVEKAKTDYAANIKADYEKQLSTLTEAADGYRKTIEDLTAQNTAYANAKAKADIATEYGIPLNLADRLAGDNADDWRKDAEGLSQYFKRTAPLADGETTHAESEDSLLKTVRNLRGARD